MRDVIRFTLLSYGMFIVIGVLYWGYQRIASPTPLSLLIASILLLLVPVLVQRRVSLTPEQAVFGATLLSVLSTGMYVVLGKEVGQWMLMGNFQRIPAFGNAHNLGVLLDTVFGANLSTTIATGFCWEQVATRTGDCIFFEYMGLPAFFVGTVLLIGVTLLGQHLSAR